MARDIVAVELRRIWNDRGELKPRAVVDESRPPDAPLHSRFDWDDTEAAESWREHQASEMIRSVELTFLNPVGEKRKAREWVSIRESSGDSHKTGYQPTAVVLENPTSREILLRNMERDVEVLRRKWGHMSEFADVIQRGLFGDAA